MDNQFEKIYLKRVVDIIRHCDELIADVEDCKSIGMYGNPLDSCYAHAKSVKGNYCKIKKGIQKRIQGKHRRENKKKNAGRYKEKSNVI